VVKIASDLALFIIHYLSFFTFSLTPSLITYSLQPAMSRRFRLTLWIGCGVLIVLIALFSGVIWALRCEPEFYHGELKADPTTQTDLSDQFLKHATSLINKARKSGKWQTTFKSEQINGWLAVDFVNNHSNSVPSNTRDFRVSIQKNQVVLACRYETWLMSTVLSLSVEPYVVEGEALALRIKNVRAGLLPMPKKKLLDGISTAAERAQWLIKWRQIDGDPVALLYAPSPDGANPLAVKIENIQIADGAISISGETKRLK
jgi:hypothetical protein